MISNFDISCPYCGEVFNTVVDYSNQIDSNYLIDAQASQDYTYIEDCQVCCQPILLTPVINEDGTLINVLTQQENG